MKKGLCECGCGLKTNIAEKTYSKRGLNKGDAYRFVKGHQKRKVQYVIDEKGCWVCQLKKNHNGYAYVYYDGKNHLAHRYYYEKYKGGIPEGLQIDHLCKNRACINPEHLEAVTNRENVHRSNVTKLSDNDVSELRRMYATGRVSQREVASVFDISQQHVSDIINGRYHSP